MAAGRIAKPGSEYGPCENDCNHIDCAQTRSMAKAICHYCHKPIGYETRFYREDDGAYTNLLGLQLVHAVCLEEKIEAEQKANQEAM